MTPLGLLLNYILQTYPEFHGQWTDNMSDICKPNCMGTAIRGIPHRVWSYGYALYRYGYCFIALSLTLALKGIAHAKIKMTTLVILIQHAN